MDAVVGEHVAEAIGVVLGSGSGDLGFAVLQAFDGVALEVGRVGKHVVT